MTPAGEIAAQIVAQKLTEDQRNTILIMWAVGPMLGCADLGGKLRALGIVDGGALTETGKTVAALCAIADPEVSEESKTRARAHLERVGASDG